MTVLLLNLRNVPEDEADEVRDLLEQHDIDYYETEPSFWGFSSGGIWLRDLTRTNEAQALIEQYQQARARRMREAYNAGLRDGSVDTVWQRMLRNPVRSVITLLAVILLCLVILMPFIRFAAG